MAKDRLNTLYGIIYLPYSCFLAERRADTTWFGIHEFVYSVGCYAHDVQITTPRDRFRNSM